MSTMDISKYPIRSYRPPSILETGGPHRTTEAVIAPRSFQCIMTTNALIPTERNPQFDATQLDPDSDKRSGRDAKNSKNKEKLK